MDVGSTASLKRTSMYPRGRIAIAPVLGVVATTDCIVVSKRNVPVKASEGVASLARVSAPAGMLIVCRPWLATGLLANENLIVFESTIDADAAAIPFTVKSATPTDAGTNASLSVTMYSDGTAVTTAPSAGVVVNTPSPREFTRVAALSRPPVTVLPVSEGSGSTEFRSAFLSAVTDSVGSTARASAAAPDTCGAAMLVPLREL